MMDLHRIACNYRVGRNTASEGSLAYVILPNRGGGSDRIEILSRSRSGRWIRKYEAIWRLTNFRVKTIPPEHPLYERLDYGVGPELLEELKEAEAREYARHLARETV
jgi:hypothetical protein